jgi:alpha-1,3-glucan synthase
MENLTDWVSLYALTSFVCLANFSISRRQNLNTARNTTNPRYYTATRDPSLKDYTPSPLNWRKESCYTILLDRFADGDPSNNDFFETRESV